MLLSPASDLRQVTSCNSSRVESSRVESSRVESSRVESSRVQSSQVPLRVDPAGMLTTPTNASTPTRVALSGSAVKAVGMAR